MPRLIAGTFTWTAQRLASAPGLPPVRHHRARDQEAGDVVSEIFVMLNMNFTATIPPVGPKLAVEYFFVCSRR
jgi:hypothetical protein